MRPGEPLRIQTPPAAENAAMRVVLVVASLLTLLPAQDGLLDPGEHAHRRAAAAALADAMAMATDLPTTVALAAIAGVGLAPDSSASKRLQAALLAANQATADEPARRALRSELGDLVAMLQFQPLKQAELPAGFPAFGAVDEIERKDYPLYRMVRTTMRGGSNSAFWPLFRHIESNGIAMTTPVQVDWQAPQDGSRERPTQMAFLYGDPGITPETTADGVEVVVVPAASVLSIGVIGDDRRDRVEALGERLRTWLAAHPEWEAAGPLRTMGYNSPMVPRDERGFEVQLPIQPAAVVR
jgi:hypothetical protein